MKRELEPKMLSYLDGKLASNGLAQHAIKTKDARTLFRLSLEACVGIRETRNKNNQGPMVELIQETCGGADKEPWCMSLVQTGLAYAEKKTGKKSPVTVSEHCLTVWNTTPKTARVKQIPATGAIIIWRHGTSSSGHTGITISEVLKGKFRAVEGNTESGKSSSGAIVREGGGVYVTERSMSGAGTMKVMGYLKPF